MQRSCVVFIKGSATRLEFINLGSPVRELSPSRAFISRGSETVGSNLVSSLEGTKMWELISTYEIALSKYAVPSSHTLVQTFYWVPL